MPEYISATTTSNYIPTTYYAADCTGIPMMAFSSPVTNVKENIEKVDKHIDDLEVDINFLNDERIKHEEIINHLMARMNLVETKNKELDNEITNLKNYITYLESKVEK